VPYLKKQGGSVIITSFNALGCLLTQEVRLPVKLPSCAFYTKDGGTERHKHGESASAQVRSAQISVEGAKKSEIWSISVNLLSFLEGRY